MRIAIVNSKGPGGGGAHQAFQLARQFHARGHDVWFVSRPGVGWEQQCADAGPRFHPVAMRSSFDLSSANGLFTFFRDEAIDICQVQKGREFGLALVASYRLPKLGLIVYRGVSRPVDLFQGLKYRVPRVDRFVGVADFIRDQLIAAGTPAGKTVTIRGGVDPTRFVATADETDAIRKEFGLTPKQPVVGYVAHLREWKRHEDFLEAIALLKSEFPDIRGLCVGRKHKEFSPPLEALQAKLDLNHTITFTGERSDVPAILSACDVSINCADGSEGITGALRESLLMEVPVIATEVAGNPEMIVHGTTGLLVPPRNPGQLAEAIALTLKHPDQAKKLAIAGKRWVEKTSTADVQADRYLAMYREVIAERRK